MTLLCSYGLWHVLTAHWCWSMCHHMLLPSERISRELVHQCGGWTSADQMNIMYLTPGSAGRIDLQGFTAMPSVTSCYMFNSKPLSYNCHGLLCSFCQAFLLEFGYEIESWVVKSSCSNCFQGSGLRLWERMHQKCMVSHLCVLRWATLCSSQRIPPNEMRQDEAHCTYLRRRICATRFWAEDLSSVIYHGGDAGELITCNIASVPASPEVNAERSKPVAMLRTSSITCLRITWTMLMLQSAGLPMWL